SIAAAMVAFGAVAQAQVEQATITGTVLDEAGGVVPGARVVAVQAETQVSRETLTNGAGHYAIPYLPVGTYELTAELTGFSRARVNGGRLRPAVLLDGAEQRNSTTNDLNYTPPLESVQEFKVVTNGLSAEFGRTGGGVITSATRSGTNDFHGSAYGYVRSDALNANSWTNKRNNVARGKEDIKQYGFTVGGPLVKDRTFFFVN